MFIVIYFADLNKGNVTGNLVFRWKKDFVQKLRSSCRVLDDDRSGYLGFKEFLQAIDLMGARWGSLLILNIATIKIGLLTTNCGGLSRCTTRTTRGRWTSRRWRT